MQNHDATGPAGEGHTLLTFTVGPEFSVGDHELLVTASDKAGNQSHRAVPFSVDQPRTPGEKPGENGKPGEPKPSNDVVPGVEEKDLTNPETHGPDGWSTWQPGKVELAGGAEAKLDRGRPAKASANSSGTLSYTGAAVGSLSALAGLLLMAGVLARRRAANAR